MSDVIRTLSAGLSTPVAAVESLGSFPALVTLNPARIDYASTKPDGSDIRFVDADGTTVLSYETNLWSWGGTSTFWVNVPLIDAGSVTVPGVIGSGRDFNGASCVRVLDSPSLRITGSITLEAFCFKRVVADQTLLAKYRPPGTRYYLLGFNYADNPNGPYALFSNNGNFVPGGFLEFAPSESLNTWMHLAAVFDTASAQIYVNGADDNGSRHYLNGILDEVRISATACSADWFRAQYHSMSDASISYGA